MGIDYTKRPAAAQPPAQPPAQPAGGLVSLTKAAPTVSLTKHAGSAGVVRVNLNWNARPPAHGLFRKTASLDLDLGCLYEFADGGKGVVQALGNTFRAADGSGRTLISLDGDDRSGTNAAGENLTIDFSEPNRFRRVLVFALIYEGAANWADAAGVVTVYPTNAAPIEIKLDEPRNGARICGIAQLVNEGGEIVVRREVNYLDGAQRALDEAYGWGMNWTRGRK
jgi:tellurite resistance protein TerA